MWSTMSTDFFSGQSVTLVEMLDAREKRRETQKKLLAASPKSTLISMTMNIPGPVKNNRRLDKIFSTFIDGIVEEIPPKCIFRQVHSSLITGPECYLVVKEEPKKIKELLIQFEEKKAIGRLFDLDVLYLKNEIIESMGRAEINRPPRSCFICEKEAKVCGRNRSHSVVEMQQVITAWLREENFDDKKSLIY